MKNQRFAGGGKPQPKLSLKDMATVVGGQVTPAAVSDEEKRAELQRLTLPAARVEADIPPAAVAAETQTVGEQENETVEANDQETLLRSDGRTWKDKNPRVICYFQARLPEPLKEKLAVVARLTPRTGKRMVSEHSILLEELERGLDRRLRALGYKP